MKKGIYKHSEEIRKKLSEAKKGEKNPMYGKKLSKEHRQKISLKLRGRTRSNNVREKISKALKGKHVSPKTEFKKGIHSGKNHPNWRGGISNKIYPKKFKEIKDVIRKRDKYTCQECLKIEKELRYKLSVHHIDYNKRNNKQENLTSLCKVCHAKTNYGRKEWIHYYQRKRRLIQT